MLKTKEGEFSQPVIIFRVRNLDRTGFKISNKLHWGE